MHIPNAHQKVITFVTESNRIEGIERPPTDREIKAHHHIWSLDVVMVPELEMFVGNVAGAPLRREPGQDVRVGTHVPRRGGPEVVEELQALVSGIGARFFTPFEGHQRYEHLHPFMDGNGRSGRALWAWHMMRDGLDPFALPFLHRWYYQSLDAHHATNAERIVD